MPFLLDLLKPGTGRVFVLGVMMAVGGLAGAVLSLTEGRGLGPAAVQLIIGLSGVALAVGFILNKAGPR